MKKITPWLVCFVVVYLLAGSFNIYNSPVDFKVVAYSIDNASDAVKAWAESNSKSGTYLAKSINSNGLETYYIHMRDIPLYGFGLSGNGRSGLKLDIKTADYVLNKSEIVEIIARNKKASYIVMNGEKIVTSHILVLSTK